MRLNCVDDVVSCLGIISELAKEGVIVYARGCRIAYMMVSVHGGDSSVYALGSERTRRS